MYYEGTYDEGMKPGYRLVVTEDVDAENPLFWGSHVKVDGDIYQRWARGEVYTVSVEQRAEYVNVNDEYDIIVQWNLVDSLGGCYLDSDYTCLDVARENGWEGVA